MVNEIMLLAVGTSLPFSSTIEMLITVTSFPSAFKMVLSVEITT